MPGVWFVGRVTELPGLPESPSGSLRTKLSPVSLKREGGGFALHLASPCFGKLQAPKHILRVVPLMPNRGYDDLISNAN